MANNEENLEDMYSLEDGDQSISQGKDAAKQAGKVMAERTKKIATNPRFMTLIAKVLPKVGLALLVIGLLFLLISVLVFMFSGPDMLMGQIIQMADELWTQLKQALVGMWEGEDYAAVTEQHVLDVAKYINQMGFNLVNYGFVGFKDYEKGETEKEVNKLKMENKEVVAVESDLITEYLAAENRTYMLSSVSISSLMRWWSGAKIFPLNNEKPLGDEGNTGAQNSGYGTGMIDLETEINAVPEITVTRKVSHKRDTTETQQVKIPWDREASGEDYGQGGRTGLVLTVEPEVDREKRKLTLKIKQKYYVDGKTIEQKDECVYNLEGWTGRYGKPIEFLLALHIGTMAPGFAEAIATRAEFDTKVHIQIHKAVEYVELYYKGFTLDQLELQIKEEKAIREGYLKALNDISLNPVSDEEIEEAALKYAEKNAGVTLQEIEDARAYQLKETKEIYTPYITSVDNHWYKNIKFKDLNTAPTSDAYVVTNPTVVTSSYKKFQVKTYKTGEIYQDKEPLRTLNQDFEALFEDTEWYKVDGLKGIVTDSEGNPVESKITLGDDIENALTMINKAAQNSDDAKLILRDLKEWIETKKYKFTDTYLLTNKEIQGIDGTGNGDSSSNTGSSTSNESSTTSTTGTTGRFKNLLGDKTAGIIYTGNDAKIKTSELPSGTTVRSIVDGKVEQVSENEVQIRVTSPKNLKDNVVILNGLKMDSGIKVGDTVSNNTPIAQTVSGKDIGVKMQNSVRQSISVKDNL